ncbi:MAG: H-NS histone family protein [Candidatus Accumulibacter sp.]|nr:H-NS histone family protein [Accumulibacter sp.]
MNSYDSILTKISMLQKRASSLRENEKRHVIAEMRKLVGIYEIQPAELFSNAKAPSAKASIAGKALSLSGKLSAKRVLPPKYRDPATGKTWNGHGKRPFWLPVDNREAFLIDAQSEGAGSGVKPKRGAPAKAKPATAKAAAKPRLTAKAKGAAPQKRGAKRGPRKAASPKVDAASPATTSGNA